MTSSKFKSTLESVRQHLAAHQFGTAVQTAVAELGGADELHRNSHESEGGEYAMEVRELELIVVFAVLENVQASVDKLPPGSVDRTPSQNNVAQLNAAIEELSVADELSATPIIFSPILNTQRCMLRLRLVKLLALVRVAQGKHTSALVSWNVAVSIATSIGMLHELPTLHLNAAFSCLRLSASRAKEALAHSHKAYLATVAILGTIRQQLNDTQQQQSAGSEQEEGEDVCVLALRLSTADVFDESAAELRTTIASFVSTLIQEGNSLQQHQMTTLSVNGGSRGNSRGHTPLCVSPARSHASSRAGSRMDTSSPMAGSSSPWYSPPSGVTPEEATDFTVEIKEVDEACILPMRFLEWSASDRQNVPKKFPFLQLVLRVEEGIKEAEGRSLQTQYIGQIRQWGGVLALCYRSTGRCLEALGDEKAAIASYAAGSATAKQCLGSPHIMTSACDTAYHIAVYDAKRRTVDHSPPRITKERTTLTKSAPAKKVEPVFRNVSVPSHGRRVLRPYWNTFFNSQAPPLIIPDDVLLRYDRRGRGGTTNGALNNDMDGSPSPAANKSAVGDVITPTTTTSNDDVHYPKSPLVNSSAPPSVHNDGEQPSHNNSTTAMSQQHQQSSNTSPNKESTSTTTTTHHNKNSTGNSNANNNDSSIPVASKLKKKTFKHMRHVYGLKYDPAHYNLTYVDERDDVSFHKRDNQKARDKRIAERKKEELRASTAHVSEKEAQELEADEAPPTVTNDHAAVFDEIMQR